MLLLSKQILFESGELFHPQIAVNATHIIMIFLLCPNTIVGLCGFGKVAYPHRHLHFPYSDIKIPDHAEIGTRWVTSDKLFDCAIFGVDIERPDILEASCCLIGSTDVEPWGEVRKRRLLRGIHQIFMEAGLG